MPIAFSLEALREEHGCTAYVETGLWDCAHNVSAKQALQARFTKVTSIELCKEWITKAHVLLSPFIAKGRLQIIEADSAKTDLASLVPADERAVFFLDAHVDRAIPEKATRPCPLLEELASIKTHNRKDHVILVDDVRLLRQERPWGDAGLSNALDKITQAIRDINPDYSISFLDGYVPGDVLCATTTEK